MKTTSAKLIIGVAAMLLAALLTVSSPAQAFSPSDSDTLFNAFNNTFYSNAGHNGNSYYKYDSQPGTTGTGWWTYAEEIEMAEDAYNRTQSAGAKSIVSNLCNDFIYQYGTLWTADKYNDDVTWAEIAFARAYQITGNTTFRDCAKNNFDAVYSRAYDTSLGGGLWWTTDKTCKNACVNGPAAIAAVLINQNGGNSGYLTIANNLYNWEWNNLYNPSTGQVYDNKNSSGALTNWVFTYNLGTFIGAADYLGHSNDANMAASYAKNSMCTNGLLPDATPGNDAAGFNGIFLRWMAKYMKDSGQQGAYLPWLQLNANAALNVRRSDNLSWCNWDSATPGGTIAAWTCVNAVIALQVIPPDGAVSIAGTHTIVCKGNGLAIDNGSVNRVGAGVIQWTVNGGAAQKWTFTQNSDTSWNIINQFSGQALDDGGTATLGGQMLQYTANGNNNQRWWVDKQADGSFKIWNKGNSLSLDDDNFSTNKTPLVQWTWNGGVNQLWLLE